MESCKRFGDGELCITRRIPKEFERTTPSLELARLLDELVRDWLGVEGEEFVGETGPGDTGRELEPLTLPRDSRVGDCSGRRKNGNDVFFSIFLGSGMVSWKEWL